MIDRQKGEIKFGCDGCGEVYDSGTDEFNDARALFERDGWKIRREGFDWLHYCPRCGG
jgi:hypothetical protein